MIREIATPVCGLVRNDTDLRAADMGRKHMRMCGGLQNRGSRFESGPAIQPVVSLTPASGILLPCIKAAGAESCPPGIYGDPQSR